HDVDVMKTEIGNIEAGDEIERFVELVVRRLLIQLARMPRAFKSAGAENIEPVPAETMPVADCKAQMLRHGLAEDLAVLVVILIRERILALRSLEFDFRYV